MLTDLGELTGNRICSQSEAWQGLCDLYATPEVPCVVSLKFLQDRSGEDRLEEAIEHLESVLESAPGAAPGSEAQGILVDLFRIVLGDSGTSR